MGVADLVPRLLAAFAKNLVLPGIAEVRFIRRHGEPESTEAQC